MQDYANFVNESRMIQLPGSNGLSYSTIIIYCRFIQNQNLLRQDDTRRRHVVGKQKKAAEVDEEMPKERGEKIRFIHRGTSGSYWILIRAETSKIFFALHR